jgi:signal transduction histidine kinase
MKTTMCKIINDVKNRLCSKITVQLLIIFSFCALVSVIFFNASMFFVRKFTKDYERKTQRMLIDGYNLSLAMQNQDLDPGDTERIRLLINSVLEDKSYTVILTDLDGNVLYQTSEKQEEHEEREEHKGHEEHEEQEKHKGQEKNKEQEKQKEQKEQEKQLDNPSLIIEANGDTAEKMTIAVDRGLYAVKLDDTIIQLTIASSDNVGWIARYTKNGVIPGFFALLSILLFIFLFFLLTRGKISYITELASGVKFISKGNLDYRVGVRGNDELALLAKELNHMTCELNDYFEREKNREKSRSELMISLSHDLKSPLTAVIGYLSLLKGKAYNGDAAMADYVERAYHKSLKIKDLLQELLDFASLSNEDIKLNRQVVSLKHLLEQLISEYIGLFEQNSLRIITDLTDGNVCVEIDPDYMIRVFENLFSNSLRYSMKPGDIRIALKSRDGSLVFSITNKCEEIEHEKLERLFDKFYRLEKSRSEETGGTGLGLAIAKRITELHGGKIWAEYANNEITFFVELPGK